MKTLKPRGKRRPRASALAAVSEEQAFSEVVEMIQASRNRALAAVNTALIDLYWRIGEYISRKLETAAWGEGVVEALRATSSATIRASEALPGATCSGCGSSSKPTGRTKKSHHW